ncbi:MAG: branched-chain amino acid ABC transporter permease, partial [Actinobacteria bacterium]|nr:branched-chain amino acid ABC transporter permease [Actinomycetota bacterium]
MSETRRVVVSSLTLGGAVGIFALSFGVASVSAGASVWQTCALSLFVFTGASQFSAMSVVGAGGSMLAAYGGAVLLAARNLVYGLALSSSAKQTAGNLPRRLFAAHFVIDETTALALPSRHPDCARSPSGQPVSVLFSFWNLGTLIGAMAGSAIDPEKFGLDIAFPAAFIVMLVPHLRSKLGRQAAVLGGALCLVSISFLPIGVPICFRRVQFWLGCAMINDAPTNLW